MTTSVQIGINAILAQEPLEMPIAMTPGKNMGIANFEI